jgi:hypothetical protein
MIKMKEYIFLGLLLSVLIIIFIAYEVPSKDDFSPENPLFNGLSQASMLAGMVQENVGSLSSAPPNSTLFIIGPDKSFSNIDANEVKSFLKAGGTVILMDDFGTGNSLLEALDLNVRFDGRLLMDPLFMYRNPALPIVKFSMNGSALNVYFNYATVLDGNLGNRCIGYSSAFSFLDSNENGVKDQDEPFGPFCVAASFDYSLGRLIVISDSSVFINSMLDKGMNEKLLSMLSGNGKAILLVGYWNQSEYTFIRNSLMSSLYALLNTWLLYPFVIVLTILGAASGKIAYISLAKRGKGEDLQNNIQEILKRHPDWDEEALIRLREEMRQ